MGKMITEMPTANALTKKGPKWTKNAGICPKWSKMAQNVPKWQFLVPKWSKKLQHFEHILFYDTGHNMHSMCLKQIH